MKLGFLKYIVILILSATFGFNLLFADGNKPQPPVNFNIVVQQGSLYGKFRWKIHGMGNSVDSYKLYYAEGNTHNISDFIFYREISSEDSLKVDGDGFYYVYIFFQKGLFSFYLTALKDNNESDPSNIVTQNFSENHARIEFTSHPDSIAYVSETYTYNVQASASNGDKIIYSLTSGCPPAMNINSETGKLTWKPAMQGLYPVLVKAQSKTNATLFNLQSWNILVKKCRSFSCISGTINFRDGGIVDSGIVKIFSKPLLPNNEPVLLFSRNFIQGHFTIPLDEGTYLIRFEGNNFSGEWYEDANSWQDATPFNIGCGDSVTIDVKVDKNNPFTFYNVSGSVTKASDANPIAGARVWFIGKDKTSGEKSEASTWTGMNGKYQIKLPSNNLYIAFTTGNDTTSGASSSYLTQFYNLADNPSEASVIELTADRNDINFILKEKPMIQNSLGGTLKDHDGNPIPGVNIIAFRIKPDSVDSNNQFISRATVTDTNGNFQINGLLPGYYILMLFEPERLAIPGYYSDSALVRSWREATRIFVGDNTDINNIVIIATRFPGVINKGKGTIRGVVTATVLSSYKSNHTEKFQPVAGAIVFALDQNNSTLNFTFSDNNGNYVISQMKHGKYKIFADKVGFNPYNENVILDSDSSDVSNDITLSPATTDVADSSTLTSLTIYPNPANNEINFVESGITGTINLSLYNSVGQLLMTTKFESAQSNGNYKLDISTLPAGFYYLRINSGLDSKVLPLDIIR